MTVGTTYPFGVDVSSIVAEQARREREARALERQAVTAFGPWGIMAQVRAAMSPSPVYAARGHEGGCAGGCASAERQATGQILKTQARSSAYAAPVGESACCNCEEVYAWAEAIRANFSDTCNGPCTIQSIVPIDGSCWLYLACPTYELVGCHAGMIQDFVHTECVGDTDGHAACPELSSCCDFDWVQNSWGMSGPLGLIGQDPAAWGDDAATMLADGKLFVDVDADCPSGTRMWLARALSFVLQNIDLVEFALCRIGRPGMAGECLTKRLLGQVQIHATSRRRPEWAAGWAVYDRTEDYVTIPCNWDFVLNPTTTSSLQDLMQFAHVGDTSEMFCSLARLAKTIVHEFGHSCFNEHSYHPCDWVSRLDEQFALAMKMRYPALRSCYF